MRLATIGKKIGIKALREVAMIVKPETIPELLKGNAQMTTESN